MRYQLSYNSVVHLRTILQQTQLETSFGDVKNLIRDGIRNNIDILQRNFIEKMIKKGESTTEIRNRARINLGPQSCDRDPKGWKMEIKRLWNIRLTSKNHEI